MLHRVVIVGGGAGGLELATRLGNTLGKKQRAQIVLVDRSPTHIWKPLLHEVAAGSMDPHTHQLEYAAQARWHNFEFQQGELQGLNRSQKWIQVAACMDQDGVEILPARQLAYDTLILSIGSVTHFFGVPGAAEHTIALDTAQQAEKFRRRLIAACMRAQTGLPETEGEAVQAKSPQVAIAVIGAGATGVELSAELRNTAHVLAAYGLHRLDPGRDIGIRIIEAGPRILPALPERVSTETSKLLETLGIEVLTGERVTEIQPNAVLTASGKVLPADLMVWSAGIQAPKVLATLDGLAVNRAGQIVVKPTLQSETDANIFAFGDCASCIWLGKGMAVPPRAQVAHQQATFLSKALPKHIAGQDLAEFRFHDMGSLVSLGRLSAVGNLMGGLIGGNMLIEGIMARLMYASLYRMHVLALHGVTRMVLDTISHWLRSKTLPRVKLH